MGPIFPEAPGRSKHSGPRPSNRIDSIPGGRYLGGHSGPSCRRISRLAARQGSSFGDHSQTARFPYCLARPVTPPLSAACHQPIRPRLGPAVVDPMRSSRRSEIMRCRTVMADRLPLMTGRRPWRLDHRAFSGLSRPPRAGYLTAYDAQPDRRRPALASLCDRFLPLADLPLSTRGWSDQQTYGTGKIGKGAEMGSNMSSRHVRRRALAPPDPPVLSRRLAYAVDKHHSSVEGWPSG